MQWKTIKTNFKLHMTFFRRPLTVFLASNLLAQFSRQIVVQILGGRRNTYGGVVRTSTRTVVRTPTRTVVRTSTANYV
jgi:hypothetical protein